MLQPHHRMLLTLSPSGCIQMRQALSNTMLVHSCVKDSVVILDRKDVQCCLHWPLIVAFYHSVTCLVTSSRWPTERDQWIVINMKAAKLSFPSCLSLLQDVI